MNLIDAVVTKVYGKPVKLHDKYWVPVEYVTWGKHTATTRLMFENKDDAEAVKEGFRFAT